MGPAPGAPTVSLAGAVSLALEGNFGLRAAADGLTAARHFESAARSEFYPKFTPRYSRSSLSSTYGLDANQRLPWTGGRLLASVEARQPTDPLPLPSSDIRLTLTQPLLRGFGPNATFFSLTNARRGRVGEERSFELARQALAVQTTSAFYQVVKQRQLLEVARQSLRRTEALKEASEARMKVGLVSKLDVFRAQIQASQAKEAMVAAEAGLETALESFRILLGRSPSDPLEPEAAALADVPDAMEPVEVLVARALANRLELRESRDRVEDAVRAASLSRQSLLPQVDLNVGLTQAGFGATLADAFRAVDRRVNVSVTTAYPLERTADLAEKAVARLRLEARKRDLKQRELEIEAEVRGAVRNLERIRKSVDLQRQGLELAEQQRQLANLRYQRGLVSNFDVVDAEDKLVSARTALVNLLTDYRVARIQLLRATGTLDVAAEFTP